MRHLTWTSLAIGCACSLLEAWSEPARPPSADLDAPVPRGEFRQAPADRPSEAEAADQSSSWAWRARLAAARTLLEDYREHPTDDGLAHAAKRALRPLVDQSAHQGVRDAATRLWDSLQGAAADHDFSIALFYDRNSLHPEAARAAYRRFLDSHPDAPQATDAKRRLIYLMASDLPLRIRPQVDLVVEFPPTQSP